MLRLPLTMMGPLRIFAVSLFILLVGSYAERFTTEEEIFLEVPSAASARSNLRFLTKQPHVAGTVGDHIMADFVPNVSTFDLQVLLNYPQAPPKVTLYDAKQQEILYQAQLSEDILSQDDTSDTIWRNLTFHGYSPSGNVRAPMVYANYGRPQDFDALHKAGVSVNGTIVLVRYGQCFRGLKVQNSQRRGALGVLIYSDPEDDGYGQGPVYPDGPWRPPHGIQRGSVQFNSQCAGDPMRADPRYGNQTVQDICGVQSTQDLIPSIPSLPLSYEDATPLLRHMGGPLAETVGGKGFCGGIHNVTYQVGPSHAVLELVVQNEDSIRKIPNVVGVIPGILPPHRDMPVLLGNHRDAW
jgi:N-acetylated-alpha-linked acidic dipeptidase